MTKSKNPTKSSAAKGETMKEIVFDRKNLKSYKDFYAKIYKDLDGKNTIDWETYENLGNNADLLNEFLWYKSDESIKYIFKNFIIFNIINIRSFYIFKNFFIGFILFVILR